MLIADDEPIVRDVLADSIRSEPAFELVGEASDATEAIAIADAQRPDVVLLDVDMPAGGGLEAAKGIKKCSPGSKMIALSGNGDRSTVLAMLEVGVVGYLIKGCPIDEIIRAVKRAPEGQGSLSPEVTSDIIDELSSQLAIQSQARKKQSLQEQRIRLALQDEKAFAMVFQPIVALRGRKLIGVEALARFAGPPTQTPDVWFADAAEVGLGDDLELVAVQKAAAAMRQLPSDVYLAVNVSPTTLAATAFHDLVSRVNGGQLVVEITEHARIADYDRLADAVSKLRCLGVRLAVDDAGSGFASLRHILNLDPDLIKLDMTLINGIDLDRSKQALAAGLISFAEKSDTTIVAEGIESDAELGALIKLGVGFGQGWLLGRPAPQPGAKPPREQSALASLSNSG
ncbi:MAG TPA: EAL domain-containing protein [Gaiellaceae bacterium]|nr:EAL domain-containing protein [Gaiellaceae bacterium]